MSAKKDSMESSKSEARWLPRLSLFVFDRARIFALLWLVLTIFGALSYTTFLKREGFPNINIPFSAISGAYLVNDAQKIDAEIAGPLSDLILKDDRVASIMASARSTFYSIIIQYDEGTDATQAGKELEQRIKSSGFMPKQASLTFTTPKFGFTERGDDAVVSVYSTQQSTADGLVAAGREVATFIKKQTVPGLTGVSVINQFVAGVDPATGAQAVSQTGFDRYGFRQDDQNAFFDSAAVGITQRPGTDVIEFDKYLRESVDRYNQQQAGKSSYRAAVSAGFAPQIKEQISELQRALLEGLLAVLIIGSVVIAIRASLITVLSMLTVLTITVGLMLIVGYTLNTITLFSLILCLALIVDDTIIMVEALDAQRRRRKDPRETVHVATGKISRAMVAATFTAVLSFAPLLFVGGILGNFVRAIPVTVIGSLLVSLFVALVFIPVFAKRLLLGPKQMGAKNVHEPAARVEARIARFISRPMLWARHSTKRLVSVGLAAVLTGFVFIGAAGYLFQKVTFNIFPPTKDTNGLALQLEFPAGSTVTTALEAARSADEVVAKQLGGNFRHASYYATGDAQTASLFIEITPYNERDVRSPELVAQLKAAYQDFGAAKVSVSQLDVGPPAALFTVRIEATDRQAALRLAADVQMFLQDRQLTRPSGEKAKVINASVTDPAAFERVDSTSYLQVTAGFDGTDTSTLVTLAQDAVEKEFTADKLKTYGLASDAIRFDFGQESENQESFKTLAIAFPLLLLAIYILLAFQFRSLAQPLLIFMAIPFSLFGITLGLYVTDNAFSFFAMLGFFALIGLSLKNTILLTDYANQQRRLGLGPVDAAVEALAERFRPLVATSLTAIVSLLPLALMSPFWEGLTVVLICGLLSSTLLVILVFPYYYLGAEFLRSRVSRKACLLWLGLTIALTVLLTKLGASAALLPLIAIAVAVGQYLATRSRH